MSATNRIQRVLVLAAALSFPAITATAQSFDAAHTARNQARASAPRSLEAYPWLAFQAGKSSATARTDKSASRFAAVKNHAGLSATPRMIEEYPQLVLQPAPARTSPKTSDTPAMLQNPAIAASPRIFEEFPALSRPATGPAATPIYEIAPLK